MRTTAWHTLIGAMLLAFAPACSSATPEGSAPLPTATVSPLPTATATAGPTATAAAVTPPRATAPTAKRA